ncbi:MAG TPA: hypothetical protein VN626_08660 [Clostridia bacterium]|nr:hypothetical protein [Clostridia bacterium]
MNSYYNSLLNPKRKENLTFVLSNAFADEVGNPLEWEMRELSAAEGAELARENASNIRTMTTMVAHSLVKPNLRNAEFLKALSQQRGRSFLDPAEALTALVTDSELAKLILLYELHNTIEIPSAKPEEAAFGESLVQ